MATSSQMEQTVELLRTKYMVTWISYRGLQRLETFPIPREALREAVLNALIHKDYSSGTPIQIRVYRNKLRIWNPGQLPPTWTADKLLQPHDSRPPNPDVASTVLSCGAHRSMGTRLRRFETRATEAGAPARSRVRWQGTAPNGNGRARTIRSHRRR